MEIFNSKQIPYNKIDTLKDSAVVLFNKRFYKIKSIGYDEFIAYAGKDSVQNFTKHLIPYGKGVDNYGRALYIFDETKLHPDTPELLKNGSPYTKLKIRSEEEAEKYNYTKHIVHYSANDGGGYVTFDYGNKVQIKTNKTGKILKLDKKYLIPSEGYMTKNFGMRMIFKYDEKNPLPKKYNKNQQKDSDLYNQYLKIFKTFDPLYQMSDDPRVRKSNEAISDKLRKIYDQMDRSEKKRVNKLINK